MRVEQIIIPTFLQRDILISRFNVLFVLMRAIVSNPHNGMITETWTVECVQRGTSIEDEIGEQYTCKVVKKRFKLILLDGRRVSVVAPCDSWKQKVDINLLNVCGVSPQPSAKVVLRLDWLNRSSCNACRTQLPRFSAWTDRLLPWWKRS